jgi:hypothetical protein
LELGNWSRIAEQIRVKVTAQAVRVTAHAQAEMVEEGITLDEVFEALRSCRVLENYPEHRRSACCLVIGRPAGRPLHVVCTTAQPVLIVITVYEPKPPKWRVPEERGTKQ